MTAVHRSALRSTMLPPIKSPKKRAKPKVAMSNPAPFRPDRSSTQPEDREDQAEAGEEHEDDPDERSDEGSVRIDLSVTLSVVSRCGDPGIDTLIGGGGRVPVPPADGPRAIQARRCPSGQG
jgi:hypothetical protein